MDSDHFCDALGSSPQPALGLILVTGATGYVGGRLVPELLARGYRVRVLVRARTVGEEARWPGAEVAVGDATDPVALRQAMCDVHAVYYLIHSLLLGSKNMEAVEVDYARNFREAAEAAGVRRIIY